ncbi:MAG: sulfonate ABC transporter ATP-binding protein [Pseudomonadales bacterium]|nr:sulfonate ABC transporter ATP-binding protein [Pseudomonadales bacterium]MCK5790869.1 ABC transporter ATP-binding protein [Ketobacter sp.]TNC90845.1 MAG: sulfonate ABC transporter ATP-binding protein [Alcanivorax sp.]HAG92654.1 sulfonate ABC transporter ATP-binding protein [Gammaproteobacteria bacterium]HAU12901.1 sulfonate ABC transporter ATP-binding protein [Gammaproteobacteria bacterium]
MHKQSSKERGHVVIDSVGISFGEGESKNIAVRETSLNIKPGEFVCILGPSGCGKSTLLNAVAGYINPSTGRVLVDDVEILNPGPDRGMVFQQYSLLPWKTVLDNIAFGPRLAGHSAAECNSIARTFLAMIGLSKMERRFPGELSGGMQQRVGIARALANYPSVLLMDEPFGALDAQTRLMMQESLLDIWSEFGTTVLFVTHDVDEAIFLADRILIMSASPGTVIADLKVNLERPRSQEMATSEPFVSLKRECLRYIRSESMKAFEQRECE